MKMKISCIFKQALCLMSLLILTCESKRPVRKTCSTAMIFKEYENLYDKIKEFKKLFPDDITDMKLLTNALRNEFMENCSTRLHLLLFYTKDVLSADSVLPEAQKSGIKEAFLRIEDMLQLCNASQCQKTKSPEVTEGMKDLMKKINKITLKEKLHKAISEIDLLLRWINSFITNIKRNRQKPS